MQNLLYVFLCPFIQLLLPFYMLLVERWIYHSHHSLVVIYWPWRNRLPLRNIAETWTEPILQGVNAVIFSQPVYNPNSSPVTEEGGSKKVPEGMCVCVYVHAYV